VGKVRQPIPEPLAGRAFACADALELGLSRKALRGKAFRRIWRGVYAVSAAPETLCGLVGAALLVLPRDAIVVGVTGLRLHGVDVGAERPLYFASTHPYPVRRSGIVVSRVAELPVCAPGELRLASAEHCFLTAARTINLLELVIAGDWLVRLNRTSRSRLQAYVARARGRGVPLARRAAALVMERVDSPRESSLRLCLVLAGLPTPRCNVTLGTEHWPIGRVDLLYELFKLILEYEGDHHRLDRRQWGIDIGRVEQFTEEGYLVLRITAERMRRPRIVVTTVFRALRDRGYAGPPPMFSAEWCALFEPGVQ
jgi:hypothetical protein